MGYFKHKPVGLELSSKSLWGKLRYKVHSQASPSISCGCSLSKKAGMGWALTQRRQFLGAMSSFTEKLWTTKMTVFSEASQTLYPELQKIIHFLRRAEMQRCTKKSRTWESGRIVLTGDHSVPRGALELSFCDSFQPLWYRMWTPISSCNLSESLVLVCKAAC